MDFVGDSVPLDSKGLFDATDRLGTGSAELWAVLAVETRGCGFLPDRRPLILFERHVFHRETGGRFDADAPDLSNETWGGYGASGASQYARLDRAIALDRRAALRSASWGIGQVMGFNAGVTGFPDVEVMVAAMSRSESEQLQAMVAFLIANGLERPLKAHDWSAFARGYNGPSYAANRYDVRLAAAQQKYATGPLPDLDVRTAQILLTFLGYSPGPVDGVVGRFTRAAIEQFLSDDGRPPSDVVDERLLERLRAKLGAR
jgi:hypothetical protein